MRIVSNRIILIALAVFLVFPIAHSYTDPNDPRTIKQREEELKAELERIEEEQKIVEINLNVTKQKSASLERDINILDGEIYKAELSIKEKNIIINGLSGDISKKEEVVEGLENRIGRSKESISRLIIQTNYIDDYTLPEIVLANDNLSDFFVDADAYQSINKSLDVLADELNKFKGEVIEEKEVLSTKKDKEVDTRVEIQSVKNTVDRKKSDKDQLLSVNKQTERTYEQIIAEKKQQASAIRDALFSLRDSAGISFGQALDYANTASDATGVRAAFILAILKQESDLGKNVGTCNRKGDPDHKKWYNIMPGPDDNSWRDDQTIFLAIAKELGLDPDDTPLSCPLNSLTWGGAMGPSQFIPATWKGYSDRVANALGVKTANPWNPRHAFTATSMYVKDLGADAGGYTAERTAALKYYAGGNWSKPQNAFYGNQVLAHAATFQEQIDFLEDVDR